MEAKESKIIDILTENKKYIVPSYQRPYSWDRENVEKFIDDIYNSFHQNDREYFIGTLICINKGNYTYEIVDGQQRLTTLSLIFAKIKDMILNNKRAKENLQKRVLPIDDFSDKPQEPRLKVRLKDEEIYCNYILQGDTRFAPKNPTSTQNLFIDNFHQIELYLKSKYNQDELILCNLAKYILENVYVVFVETDSFNSSFRLFNVLNTRGMPLASSDLIKNMLFELSNDGKGGHEKIEKYWDDIEDIIGNENMNKFLAINRISYKKDRDRAVKNLVDEYSDLLEDKYNKKSVDLIIDIYKSAENYSRIISSDFGDSKLNNLFGSLIELSDEWMPPVLAFLNKADNPIAVIKENQFKEFMVFFEKAYMHSWFKKEIRSRREVVCFIATSAINQNKNIEEIIGLIKQYSDNSVIESYFNENLYEPTPFKINFLKTILIRIDREIQDGSVTKTYNGKITIEHILPQKISDEYWVTRFSSEQHQYWIHKLGNLTLISGTKNSQAQNASFLKKKEIYNKLGKKVSFDITKNIADYEDWNVESINKRHEELVKIAINIWSL